jgi:hypothetical protein
LVEVEAPWEGLWQEHGQQREVLELQRISQRPLQEQPQRALQEQ